jgi:hypothetical protein
MKEKHVRIKDFDLHLVDGTDWAILSLGLVPAKVGPGQAATGTNYRIELTTAHLHQMLDYLSSAANYRAKFVPPTGSSH